MPDEKSPLWRQSATHVLHAALMLRHDVETRLQEETGLLLADNEALLNLQLAEEPMRMSTIADCLILSRGGTTKVVDRLEALGLVERSQDPADRRATLVSITTAGRDALERARPVIDSALLDRWGSHLTDTEARTVLEIIERIREANPDW